METFEADVTHFQDTSEADRSLLVRFFVKSTQDKAATIKEGRPIFREREFIEIRFPGNRTDAVARPARPADIARFPRHYDAFKRRVEMPDEGTPLAEWPQISRSQVEELAFYNIKTVEQLVGMSDANAGQFMGINKLRAQAKEFLENSKQLVELSSLKTELQERDEKIAAMEAKLEKLLAQQAPEEEAETGEPEEDEDFEPAPAAVEQTVSRRRAKRKVAE